MSTPTPPLPAGLVLRPFRALRFTDDRRDAEVLVPPYDQLDARDELDYRRRSLHSMIRLTRPEGQSADRYAAAAATLTGWRADGTLRRDETPALYAYSITTPDGAQVCGLLGAVALAPASAGIVLPHEDTSPGPVADRLALLTATATDLEPIYLLHHGGPAVAEALAEAMAGPLLTDAETSDGSRHRLAAITDAETLVTVAGELLPHRALIADGHHRYQSFLGHQRSRWQRGDGPGEWDAGLAFLVDASRAGPTVRAMHRVVPELSLDDAVRQAGRWSRVQALPDGPAEGMLARLTADPDAGDGPRLVLAAGARGVLIDRIDPAELAAVMPADRSRAWSRLDVTALHTFVLPRLLAGRDVAPALRFEPLAERAVAAAERLNGTAVLLRAATVAAVIEVAAAGERMPRKSTSFVPKPASGLVLRPLDP